MAEDCIFCKIANKEIPKEFVYDDDNFMAFLDINPIVEGHTLLVPKKHFPALLDIPNTMGNEMQEAIKKISLDLIQKYKAKRISIFTEGELVSHAHIHIIPRDDNDGIKIAVNLKKIGELKKE